MQHQLRGEAVSQLLVEHTWETEELDGLVLQPLDSLLDDPGHLLISAAGHCETAAAPHCCCTPLLLHPL